MLEQGLCFDQKIIINSDTEYMLWLRYVLIQICNFAHFFTAVLFLEMTILYSKRHNNYRKETAVQYFITVEHRYEK